MRAGQVGTKLSEDLAPGRYRLAEALIGLYQRLPEMTLERAAALFADRGYGRTTAGELSRYLNGKRVPPWSFVSLLQDLAAELATPSDGLSKVELRKLHGDAERSRGAEGALCQACPSLLQERDHLRAEVERLEGLQAGSEENEEVPVAAETATGSEFSPLPVAQGEGDRQRSANEVAAARELADRAAQLDGDGDLVAVAALLQEVSEVLSPLESAAALVLLRQRQKDQLAENLIQIYVRGQADRDVIKVALELHEYGHPHDAGMVLRAAAR
ncbi:hypothetical protein [Kitasatospora sp. NPDC093806]|uniref:hypothetical protein n=1 Tax=Kitasatospora sp. NPDC093806 TaxID=3155075 RepID=UPI003435A259